jgi:acyl-CoA synthetase (AMP-forming)/AMP-acid ligase II
MGAWEIKGPVIGTCKSWRDVYPELAARVEKIRAPIGRGIAWEGTEIWAYKDRPKNVNEVLKSNIRKYGKNEAYVFHPGGQRMTWEEIGEKVNNAASALRKRYGFKKRDRLCLLTLGCPDYVVSYLAILKLGGIAVPVNLGLTPEGIAAQINKVGAKGLVVSPEIWEAKLKALRGGLASVDAVFMTGDKASDGTISFAALTKDAASEDITEEVDEWDVCAISFTSGTTGAPKGTMAMHINALGCAENVVTVAKGLSSDDINICMPPLYHNTAVYTDFMPALLTGGKCVVMGAFNPLEAIKLIEKERTSWGVAAPIMLWMMMNHPEFGKHDCSTLKKILFGGHASSETYINQLKKEFSPIAMVNAGSVSESTAVGFALPTEDAIRKITSCGLATPNTEIAIFDDDGNEVTSANVIGEVAYKGQQTNAGYWEQPEKTKEVFRKDGYVLSGDWAKIDEEGYLWLLDRKKDMIVRGGQNVYCIEVENKLYLHPKVLTAAVVGVPDHVFSERIKAVVVTKPGQVLTEIEIKEHCGMHLAHYETPEYVVFAKSILTNPAGKTLKQPLVDFWGHHDEASDKALETFRAFCKSIAEEFLDLDHLKIEDFPLTPRAALKHLEESTEMGRRLRNIVEEKGIVELLKPKEARFKQ